VGRDLVGPCRDATGLPDSGESRRPIRPPFATPATPVCSPAPVTMVWQHGENACRSHEIGYPGRRCAITNAARTRLFRIASMTKPVTVAAPDEPGRRRQGGAARPRVVRWLPEFADLRVLDDPSGPTGSKPIRFQRAILVEDPAHPHQWSGLRILGGRTDLPGIHIRLAVSGGVPTRGWPRSASCRWCISLAKRLTYGHSTDVVGVAGFRASKEKPFDQVLDERIRQPARP